MLKIKNNNKNEKTFFPSHKTIKGALNSFRHGIFT